MKLYTHPPSPNCIKVMAVANQLGLTLEQVSMDPADCKKPDYLARNPNGKVPTLQDDDYILWESNAIMVYLAQKVRGHSLLPRTARNKAELWRWMSWSMGHWNPATRTFLYERMVRPMIMGQATDEEALKRAEAAFHPLAALLDRHLADKTFVLGPKLSLADFALGANLVYSGMAGIPLEPYPGIRAWYDRIAALPSWQEAIPEMVPAEVKAR